MVAAVQAAGPHPALPAAGSLEGLGVNIHFTDPQPGEMEMIAAAGFKWVRMDLGWGGTERTKDVYDFSAYDRLAASLDKHGLRAVFILDYGNRHYADPGDKPPFTSRSATPEFRQAYARWAAAAVSHFKGKGFLWELWNEPNHSGFWKPEPSAVNYAALAKAACEAIHRAAPDEAIIGPATSTIDLPFLETCFKAGLLDSWCAVSVHPYRQQRPETVEEEYRNLRLLIRRYAPKDKTIPILSGEWGYSTAWKTQGKDEAASEEQQAKYVSRQLLTNIANDIPLSIWYDWRDDGDDPKEGEHRFGLVRRQHHPDREPMFDPKPAYLAVKTLTTQLKGMRFNKRLSFGFEQWPLLFTRGEDKRIVVWGKSRAPLDDWLPASPGAFARAGHVGNELPDVVAEGDVSPTLKLRISDAPQYLTPRVPNNILRIAAAWDRLPLELVVEPHAVNRMSVAITNPLDQPVTFDEPQLGSLAPGECRMKELQFGPTRRERTDASFDLVIAGMCRVSQKTVLLGSKPLRIIPLPAIGNTLPVQIENPSGDAFTGALELDRNAGEMLDFEQLIHEPKRLPIEFRSGQTERLISIPLPGSLPQAYIAELRLFEGGEDRLGRLAAADAFERAQSSVGGDLLKAVKLIDFDNHDSAAVSVSDVYSSWVDGDAKVTAKCELALQPSPQGLPATPTATLRVSYQFNPGWRFLQIAEKGRKAIQGQPKSFGLWVHSDGKGCTARIRFTDASGQVFQADGPKLDWTGWRFVSIPMQASEQSELTHWAGAKDGVIHYPIQWDTLFLLDNTDRKEVAGEVFLSSPTLFY